MSEPESPVAATTAAEPPGASPARSLRTALILLAKVAVAVGLIYWLISTRRLDLRVFGQISWSIHAFGLAAVGVGAVFFGQWLLAVRLLLLLRHGKVPIGLSRIFGVTLVGSLFSVVLPGLVGGDIVRAVYLCGDAVGRKAVTVGTVILDRVIGLYSLFFAGALAWAVLMALPSLVTLPKTLWLLPLITAVMTAGFWVAGRTQWPRWAVFRPVWKRLPESLQDMVVVLQDCVGYPRLMLATVGLSVLNHLLVICTFLIAAALLGDVLPWPAHFVLSPLAMVMNMVALTPGGIGLTEGAFSLLYENAGSTNGANIAIFGRLIQYATFVTAGCGAILWVRLRTKT
jgi:glycosyltransferase 2 family protein